MLFFDPRFILGFTLFFAVYSVAPQRLRYWMIVIASYLAYSFWDWRFLSLLMLSTFVDYYAALVMSRDGATDRTRRIALAVSMTINLGTLGLFKYFNFFADSATALLTSIGFGVNPVIINVILPAGISFYTFQTMSYVIDVYRREIEAERDPIVFAAFVSYFPQLVAGPIERAGNLLGRIRKPDPVTLAGMMLGLRLFVWGMFKKLYVADNLAPVVDWAFQSPGGHTTTTLVFAAWAFAFQIYCDFSGYTDMARGLGKMMGIDLMLNFNLPYFAKSFREFWRRWHISLSTWFRDYVYIPLGGNRSGNAVRNLMLTMTASGLWHGAAWPFVVWGFVHGSLVAVEHVGQHRRASIAWTMLPSFLRMFIVFNIVCLLWIFFRSPNMEIAAKYLVGIWQLNILQSPITGWDDILNAFTMTDRQAIIYLLFYTAPLLAAEVVMYRTSNDMPELHWPLPVRSLVYALYASLFLIFAAPEGKQFIYFQF